MSNSTASVQAPSRYVIGFIGGGPNALYCLERILTRLKSGSLGVVGSRLAIVIYDKSGQFGPGIHSIDQPTTNHLNRTAEQVSFCADYSHKNLNIEVSDRRIVTLSQWAADKWNSSHDPRYHISNQHWVDRALLGEAMADTFAKYVAELHELRVEIILSPQEVVSIGRFEKDQFQVVCSNQALNVPAIVHFVFLCTGHTTSAPEANSFAARLQDLSSRTDFRYCHSVYPTQAITNEVVPPGSAVACQGMGLAGIDCINWLTSGRGGYFVKCSISGKLRYVASGFEPAKIYPLSESGVFAHARAYNEKENVEERRHIGVVFTEELFSSLRARRGQKRPDIPAVSLEEDIIPLLATEMMMLYYRTLFSRDAVQAIETGIVASVQGLVHSDMAWSFWGAYDSAHSQYAALVQHVDSLLTVEGSCGPIDDVARTAIVQFLNVRLGSSVVADALVTVEAHEFLRIAKRLNEMPSPWSHASTPMQHLFHWQQILDPLSNSDIEPDHLHAAVTSWLEKDILWAVQGNMSNPLKASLDGAIRDLRSCFRAQVELGATGPDGTRQLYSHWYRITNRLAVGTSLAIMKKILALAEAGVVDFSYSRNASKVIEDEMLYLSIGNDRRRVDTFLNATVHRFHLGHSDSRLYQSLRAEGLVRQWEISDGTQAFSPGAIEVDETARLVVSRDGQTVPNMAALGAPVDGPFYYRLALSRPYVADTIIFDADQAVSSMARHCGSIFN